MQKQVWLVIIISAIPSHRYLLVTHHIQLCRHTAVLSGGGGGGGGGFIMLDFQARAPKRISQTYHHAKYSSAVYLVR